MQACNKYIVKATIVLSPLRYITLYGVLSETKKNTNASIFKVVRNIKIKDIFGRNAGNDTGIH